MGLLVGPPESATDTPDRHGPLTVPEMVQFDEQLGAFTVIVEFSVLESPLASVTLIVTV